MSLPAGLGDGGLPVGLQVMAPVQRDDVVYRAAAAFEQALLERWGAPLLDRAPELEVAR